MESVPSSTPGTSVKCFAFGNTHPEPARRSHCPQSKPHNPNATSLQTQPRSQLQHLKFKTASDEIRLERLWQEFFSDTSQWWDNRFKKPSRNWPDFKHKNTKEVLWIDNRLNPSWVKAMLANIAQVQGQSDTRWTSNYASNSDMNYGTPGKESSPRFSTHCKEGRLKEAVDILDATAQDKQSYYTYGRLLQGCISKKALAQGKRVHAHIIKSGLEQDLTLGSTLVRMYSKCGTLPDARQVFDKMIERNVFSWNVMIAGYVEHGFVAEALRLFWEMQRKDVKPDKFTMSSMLKACASLAALAEGKLVHAQVVESGIESDVFLEAALVNMYAKCGSIQDACKAFCKMHKRDVVSWNAMIAAYAQHDCGEEALKLFQQMKQEGMAPDVVSWNAMIAGYVQYGKGEKALELFEKMQQEGGKPNNATFMSILKACASLAALEEGKRVHAHILRTGFDLDLSIGSALVVMYCKCGCIEDARQVFDNMHIRDAVLWNAMISGYAQHGCAEEAFKLFQQMQKEGVKPDVVSWNVMIAGYVQHGRGEEALELFKVMQKEGMKPDSVTFISILKGCTCPAALEEGKWVHAHIAGTFLESNLSVGTALVNMYSKLGSIEDARAVFNKMPKQDVFSWNAMIAGYAMHGHADEALKLFQQMQWEGVKPNVVSWNTLIAGYVQHGHEEEALELFWQMQLEGVKPDAVSWTAIIAGYAQQGHGKVALDFFRQMQQEGPTPGVVTWNAMIAGYAQHGRCDEALELFSQMQQKGLKPDVASWTAIISGYVQHAQSEKALEVFQQMQQEGIKPNITTFTSVLKACASLVALEEGKRVHALILDSGFESDFSACTALVDMYAKCGSIKDARRMFDRISKRGVASWNAMIAGYAQHSHGEEAFQLFEQMQSEGLKPDHVTFVSVLSACSHMGLVDEGWHIFESINQDYGISPTKEHYACMVDLLGRAACLNEAVGIISKMPFQPDAVLWRTLLGACRVHGNVELAEFAAEFSLKLEPKNAASYVLLSNIYAAAGRWDDRAKVRKAQ